MLTVPVHATVIILEESRSPQLTMTGGTGAVSTVPFQTVFSILIFITLFVFYFGYHADSYRVASALELRRKEGVENVDSQP